MMRKQLVTVRWPGARIAPANNTCACRQTRAENTGVKTLKRETNNGGKDSKEDHFPGHLHNTGPLRNGQSRAQGLPPLSANARRRMASFSIIRTTSALRSMPLSHK